jgi:hypothetical protein
MPDKPFVLVCQQYLADPSRSNGDVDPLYSYAHVPAGYTGDAAPLIEPQTERFAPGFRDRILARHHRSVADIEAHNANDVGGDVVTGSNDGRQLVCRPRAALDPYTTGIPGVYLCSAATPPGAGAHGMCGYNAANSALRRIAPDRAAPATAAASHPAGRGETPHRGCGGSASGGSVPARSRSNSDRKPSIPSNGICASPSRAADPHTGSPGSISTTTRTL